MNHVDALIAGGFADRLRKAAAPGETYHLGDDVRTSAHGADDRLQAMIPELRSGAPAGHDVVAWFSRSVDGERIMGEVVVQPKTGGPSLIWDLASGAAAPVLDYGVQRTLSFETALDKLAAPCDPIGVLRDVSGGEGEAAQAVAVAYGLRPAWSFGEPMNYAFRTVKMTRDHV